MTSPLLGSLAATIHSAMKNIFIDAVLTREVAGVSSDPADPAAPTTTSYTCKAVRDSYTVSDKRNTSILAGDAKILILVNSLSVTPTKDDVIVLQGSRFSVVDIDADPANAVWTIQGRK